MTAIILKTFNFAPELSSHLYCSEKFKNPFPDTRKPGNLKFSLLRVLSKIRF